MDFYLSSKSLKNIKESGTEDDFELEICGETIHCSKFVAIFFSPKISRTLRADPTITKYTLNFSEPPIIYSTVSEIKSEIKSNDFISKFQRFVEGDPIRIEVNQGKSAKTDKTMNTTMKLLLEIGYSLENDEIINSISTQLFESETNEIDAQNYKEKLQIYRRLGNKKMNEKIIEFIATHLVDIIKESDLKGMNRNELELIFSSNLLKIESEDWLFELIYSLGPEFYYLFDYIEVQYLSTEKVNQLIEIWHGT